MAQTKRKRRTKHRGTPAGTIEARGRTGRKPTPEEAKRLSRDETRRQRMTREPTWKGAIMRSGMAALLLLVFSATLMRDIPIAQSFAIAIFAFGLYIPLGYYTDRFLYRRRMAKQ